MILVTSDEIEGENIERVLGLVRGSTVRARHVGRDIMAGLRNIVGGEIEEYTRLLSEARQMAVSRMTREAEEMGANAIVGVRFMTSAIMGGASEILVYGTAVVLADKSGSAE